MAVALMMNLVGIQPGEYGYRTLSYAKLRQEGSELLMNGSDVPGLPPPSAATCFGSNTMH